MWVAMKSQKNDCLLIGMQRGLTPENFHRFLQSAEIVQAVALEMSMNCPTANNWSRSPEALPQKQEN
jgi:hypothetical protein